MAAANAERLMNLTICLLQARTPMTREQIRNVVQGYSDSVDHEAFERKFERDKNDLRRLGVPIDTAPVSVLFDDELGYRIVPSDYQLPELRFDPSEVLALGLAASVWEGTRLAEDSLRAIGKLRAAGVEIDTQRSATLAPRLDTDEPSFDVLKTAMQRRQRVSFEYKGLARTVEPWSMAYRRGSWYLFAYDTTRKDQRCFKLMRIETPPKLVGKPDVYTVPECDEKELTASIELPAEELLAVIAIRDDAAPSLRRRAVAIDRPAPLPGYHCYEMTYATQRALMSDIASYGPDVLLLEPHAARQALIAFLRGSDSE